MTPDDSMETSTSPMLRTPSPPRTRTTTPAPRIASRSMPSISSRPCESDRYASTWAPPSASPRSWETTAMTSSACSVGTQSSSVAGPDVIADGSVGDGSSHGPAERSTR